MIIVDIQTENNKITRILNIYRSFNPENETAKELFIRQTDLISRALKPGSVLLGDLNLDYNKKEDVHYCYSRLFDIFEEKLSNLGLIQLVNFDTWYRIVGTNVRSSCLDHIYVKDFETVCNIHSVKPCFGDHLLLLVDIRIIRPSTTLTRKRDWRHYSAEKLNDHLSRVDWNNDANNVQELWNDFECKLINVVDRLVPMSYFKNDQIKEKPNPLIKRKLNV